MAYFNDNATINSNYTDVKMSDNALITSNYTDVKMSDNAVISSRYGYSAIYWCRNVVISSVYKEKGYFDSLTP
jgi:hypothetical protein